MSREIGIVTGNSVTAMGRLSLFSVKRLKTTEKSVSSLTVDLRECWP